jgi:hypothetical protein
MTLHWDTVKSPGSPDGKTLMGDVWQDLQAKNPLPDKAKPSVVSSAISAEIHRRSPQEVSYSISLVTDALIRFCALDSMKGGVEYRDTVSNLADLLTRLAPPKQRPCLPTDAGSWGRALKASELYLLGTVEMRWLRFNGRSLICIKRVKA